MQQQTTNSSAQGFLPNANNLTTTGGAASTEFPRFESIAKPPQVASAATTTTSQTSFPPLMLGSSSSSQSGRSWYEYLGIQKIESVDEQATRTKQQCKKKVRSTDRSIKRLEEEEGRLAKQAKRAAAQGDHTKVKRMVRQIAMKRKQKMRQERVGETSDRMGDAVEDFQSQIEIGQNMQTMSRMMGRMANSQNMQKTKAMQQQFKQNDQLFRKNAELLDQLWDDDREEEQEFESELYDQIMMEYDLKAMDSLSVLRVPSNTNTPKAAVKNQPALIPLMEFEGSIDHQSRAATSSSSVEDGGIDQDLIRRFAALTQPSIGTNK